MKLVNMHDSKSCGASLEGSSPSSGTMTTMIDEASEAIRKGELVVFPTDTVYGIGCDPFNEDAIMALYEAKNRPSDKNIPLLVDSIESAKALAEISEKCEKLLEKFWPGALTVIVRAKTPLHPKIVKEDGTIALRMPDHEDLLELITTIGGVLAATSANISGKPALVTYDDAYATFSEKASVVLPGAVKSKEASTIVDCTKEPFKVLREGPIKI